MGSWVTSEPQRRILVLGMAGSGKTTFLYKLRVGEVTEETPPNSQYSGLKVKRLRYKNVELISWDAGGTFVKPHHRKHHRAACEPYYLNTHALIWIVDSADKQRIDEVTSCDMQEFYSTSKAELQNLLSHEIFCGVPLLILANKQDLPGAMSVQEVQDRLGMTQLTAADIEGTLLNVLPDSIIALIVELVGHRVCGQCPTKRITVHDLLRCRWVTKTLQYSTCREKVHIIVAIICRFLPPYEYGAIGPHRPCRIVGTQLQNRSRYGMEGVYEGLEWISETVQQQERERTAASAHYCALM